MPKPVLLKVFANAFGAPLDHEGRAHCHVQYEPDPVRGDMGLRWVGCRPIPTAIRTADPKTQTTDEWDHEWEYDTEPATVPLTAYYLHHLRTGGEHGPALLCADLETHYLVNGTRDGFVDPKAALVQYVAERKAHPRLKPSDAVLEARAADPTYKRDHKAEFEAWAGEHHKAYGERKAKEKADYEAACKATAKAGDAKRGVKDPTPAPSTTTTSKEGV